jgi:hypothetical protein
MTQAGDDRKRHFHAEGKVVVARKLRRKEVLAFFDPHRTAALTLLVDWIS